MYIWSVFGNRFRLVYSNFPSILLKHSSHTCIAIYYLNFTSISVSLSIELLNLIRSYFPRLLLSLQFPAVLCNCRQQSSHVDYLEIAINPYRSIHVPPEHMSFIALYVKYTYVSDCVSFQPTSLCAKFTEFIRRKFAT